ncbi:MAG: dATP/dGTP diphosphohydrolase domain-containing protein [Pseudomonadota bacterium]
MNINEKITELQSLFLSLRFNGQAEEAAAINIITKLESLRLMPTHGEITEHKIGKKNDDGKAKYHLLPLAALEQVSLVLMHGAQKYGENNWQQVEGWQHRYYNASLRHLFQWKTGEKCDSESGIGHLAHAICSLMFLIEKERS